MLDENILQEMVCRINMELTELSYKVEVLENNLAEANAHISELVEKGKDND